MTPLFGHRTREPGVREQFLAEFEATRRSLRADRAAGRHSMHGRLDEAPDRLSLAPLAQLQRTELSALHVNAVHLGKYLLLRTLAAPVKMRAVQVPVEDPSGSCCLLTAYRLVDLPERLDDATAAAHMPAGSILALKEPYMRGDRDGNARGLPFLRADSPSDLLWVTDPKDPLLEGTGWVPPPLGDAEAGAARCSAGMVAAAAAEGSEGYQAAAKLKAHGNALYMRRNTIDALACYQLALQALDAEAAAAMEGKGNMDGQDSHSSGDAAAATSADDAAGRSGMVSTPADSSGLDDGRPSAGSSPQQSAAGADSIGSASAPASATASQEPDAATAHSPASAALRLDLLNNCAAACLNFKTEEGAAAALGFARHARALARDNAKAALREAKALMGSRRYAEGADALAAYCASHGKADKAAAAEARLARRLADEQTHGSYDLLAMFEEAAAAKDGAPRLQHADYVGPIRVVDFDADGGGMSGSKSSKGGVGGGRRGRGVIAARDIAAGELLLMVKADSMVYGSEASSCPQSTLFTTPGAINSPSHAQMLRDIQPSLLAGGRLAQRICELHPIRGSTATLHTPLPGTGHGGPEDAAAGSTLLQSLAAPVPVGEMNDRSDSDATTTTISSSSSSGSLAYPLHPSSQAAWFAAHKGQLFRVHSDGSVAVNEEALGDALSLNAFAPDKLPELVVHTAGKGKVLAAPPDKWTEFLQGATGLYCLASFFNHACDANSFRLFIGDMMAVRATRAVPAGEELTLAYTETLEPLAERHSVLKKHQFQCACALCEDEERFASSSPAAVVYSKELMARFDGLRHAIRAAAASGQAPRLAARLQGMVSEMEGHQASRRWAPSVHVLATGLGFLRQIAEDYKGAAEAYAKSYHALFPKTDPTTPLNEAYAILSALNTALAYSRLCKTSDAYRGRREAQEWLGTARSRWCIAYGDEKLFEARFKAVLRTFKQHAGRA